MAVKYKLGATIPTTQYGNLQPEIEIEAEDLETAHREAMSHIQEVWRKHGSSPLTENEVKGQRLTTFTGEEVLYDPASHRYFDLNGNRLTSGSLYADRNSPKFDKEFMQKKTATAWKVDATELGDLWSASGEISSSYGNAIHKALESWHRFKAIGKDVQAHKELDENYALPKNAHIRNIVQSFDEQFGTNALVEVLISDVKNLMAGQIDRLEIIDSGDKVCRIGDYKTNNDLDDKKIKKYQHQLSFYAHTLINHGWTVAGLDIFHLGDDGWSKTELEVLDLIK